MLTTNPTEALQVLINTAHEAAMPLAGHITVDALGRLIAAALRTAPPPAAHPRAEPPPGPFPTADAEGHPVVRTGRGKVG